MPLKPRPQITQPLDPSYRLIPLTRGASTKVDAEDYEWLMQWKWYAHKVNRTGCLYAYRKEPAGKWKQSAIAMHREVLHAPPGVEVDHKFHDTLDNRKSQLRLATHQQNACNKKTLRANSSGYKGVFASGTGKWTAQITVRGQHFYLGTFASAELASDAYLSKSRSLHGEFSCPL